MRNITYKLSNTFELMQVNLQNASYNYTQNLLLDQIFSKFNLIFYGNVLIDFNRNLLIRVIILFCNSLVNSCFLTFGINESINLKFLKKRWR